MKRKIKVTDNVTNKIIEGEVEVRNLLHFEAQKSTRSHIFTPKKGKASYTRKQKHRSTNF